MTAIQAEVPHAADIAYVRLSVPDLDLQEAFLRDFGLQPRRGQSDVGEPVLYARGTADHPFLYVAEQGEPKFLGLGFSMASMADLERLAALESVPVEQSDAPGGGYRVRLSDPQGHVVDAIYGWATGDEIEPMVRPPENTGLHKPRVNSPVRFDHRSSQVKRLGHCVIFVKDFRESEAWCKERFGFLTSDEIYAGNKENAIGAFMRCDRGDTPVDHHTLFLMSPPDLDHGLHHAAFEVHDWDDLMLGHDHLSTRGYAHHWGIGKHVLGSQVFDYWKDPFGFSMEHFTDSDRFDASVPPEQQPVQTLGDVLWGNAPT